jgi:hypothetical protein
MRTHVSGQFMERVFNLAEIGSSDWEDQKPKRGITPLAVSADDVYYPVSRRYRHIMRLACVSAADNALTPMIISQSPVRDSLWRYGLR